MACVSRGSFLRLLHLFLFVSFVLTFVHASHEGRSLENSKESDRVINLPGQPATPLISHFSGYITVNQEHGRELFYWFFEAQHSQQSTRKKPLLLWFNGGPGCSSIGYGALAELGPLRVDEGGAGLHLNNFSWYREANLLFVESPAGVGFSFANTSSDSSMMSDSLAAEDAYAFLVNWLERFSEFKDLVLYIAGESYAGHYVPQLAELVVDRNKDRSRYALINLQGFIVGNPETDDPLDNKGFLEYAWSHTVISDEEYELAKGKCNFSLPILTDDCNMKIMKVYERYREINIYDVYAPKCLLDSTPAARPLSLPRQGTAGAQAEERMDSGLEWAQIRGGYDPCLITYVELFLNRLDVQSSLHVIAGRGDNSTVKWAACSDNVRNTYNTNISSVLPIYAKLVKEGLRIWAYSGDTDGRVPVLGTRYWIEALGLPVVAPWKSWYHEGQVGGRMVQYKGLTLVTVRGAGHMVPLTKPAESLDVVTAFLSARPLPTAPRR